MSILGEQLERAIQKFKIIKGEGKLQEVAGSSRRTVRVVRTKMRVKVPKRKRVRRRARRAKTRRKMRRCWVAVRRLRPRTTRGTLPSTRMRAQSLVRSSPRARAARPARRSRACPWAGT